VEKLRVYGYEGRSVVWGRREYLRELAGALGYAARKFTHT